MKQRARRWTVIVSAVAAGVAGGLVALPTGAGAGNQFQEPNCEFFDAGTSETFEGDCAELEVTKVVTGEAPAGTTFEVEVECEVTENGNNGPINAQQNGDLPPSHTPPFTETLTFGEEGGTESLFVSPFESSATCTISEEPPAPCELDSIDPETVEVTQEDVDAHAVIPVTVTNACPEAAAPVAPPAPPAPAAAAQPRFTG